MTWRYSLTWEHPNLAPVTVRGEVEAGSPSAAASNAVRDAKKKGRSSKGYRGLVVVLEKMKDQDGDEVEEKISFAVEGSEGGLDAEG